MLPVIEGHTGYNMDGAAGLKWIEVALHEDMKKV